MEEYFRPRLAARMHIAKTAFLETIVDLLRDFFAQATILLEAGGESNGLIYIVDWLGVPVLDFLFLYPVRQIFRRHWFGEEIALDLFTVHV